jgi:hypothetical protein
MRITLRRATFGFLLVWAAGISPARADTVTFRSNVAVNGTVVSLTGDELVFKAYLPNNIQTTMHWKRSDVARIEFNGNKTPGIAPPNALGSHPPAGTVPPPPQSKDILISRVGTVLPCPGVLVTDKAIQCGPTDQSKPTDVKSYDRSEGAIWRINFGNP